MNKKADTPIKIESNKAIIALVIFLFVFTLGLVGFIVIYKGRNASVNVSSRNRTEYRSTTVPTNSVEYAPIEEDMSTPIEVNNETINELDSLMQDVDNTSTEDLEDLAL